MGPRAAAALHRPLAPGLRTAGDDLVRVQPDRAGGGGDAVRLAAPRPLPARRGPQLLQQPDRRRGPRARGIPSQGARGAAGARAPTARAALRAGADRGAARRPRPGGAHRAAQGQARCPGHWGRGGRGARRYAEVVGGHREDGGGQGGGQGGRVCTRDAGAGRGARAGVSAGVPHEHRGALERRRSWRLGTTAACAGGGGEARAPEAGPADPAPPRQSARRAERHLPQGDAGLQSTVRKARHHVRGIGKIACLVVIFV
mmetsp:Transcript_18640/g.60978  ORF Transcript_18640/g.60978 Transcript_18640/m.60978 type:complete len:258 (+) Transcript_18640:1230-2003(+)